jgi:hypothetical protein
MELGIVAPVERIAGCLEAAAARDKAQHQQQYKSKSGTASWYCC